MPDTFRHGQAENDDEIDSGQRARFKQKTKKKEIIDVTVCLEPILKPGHHDALAELNTNSPFPRAEHDGLRKDGQPDQRVNQQGFAYGKVDPHEAGKKGGQSSGSGSSDSSSSDGSDNPQGAAHLGGEGLRKDGQPDQRLKMNQDSPSS
ncbi:uncharacterized protein A1O5_08180 [Cladophialophora psammophila CBS 110553]|uniref:Uncharacterized protein n=1 Tax=Cladophialophora psammophila CBS 110553 TaxID=1182543 RepID=W9WKG3_9EURO|nr:uncharacterized protein A1O5_08180 [Cladophialophora psammophila CBS 110553]EXJ68388.1 hypothetical protein A1O5_08180 [Cladophialophora psammophila CBS 110553]